MAGQLPGVPSYHEIARNSTGSDVQDEPQSYVRKWYFSEGEIEDHSPSRNDGITREEESRLRKLYCSYLKELGMELKVPQVIIAVAILLCHRFYMRQSHVKNHWQVIATACMFLACKSEETPRRLGDLVVVAYKLMYKGDPRAPQRIREKELYDKQKEMIVLGERVLLGTVAFDLNVELPYKPLIAAVKKLEVVQKNLVKVAWNFVNDWLGTTLCLRYKPHYIAAGSLALAAKLEKVKLPTAKGNVWWMQFDVSPKQLEDVIQQMNKILKQNEKQVLQPTGYKIPDSEPASVKGRLASPESCISSVSNTAKESRRGQQSEAAERASIHAVSTRIEEKPCCNTNAKGKTHPRTSNCSHSNSVVEDGNIEPKLGESDEQSDGGKIVPFEACAMDLDVHRIRDKLKRRRLDLRAEMKVVELGDDMDGESLIARQLEGEVEPLTAAPPGKRIRS